jgi:rubrerythrin
MPEPLVGVSVFDQRLYDHVSSHVENEVEALQGYEALAASTESKAFKFLAELILEDERRHHRMLADLAQTIKVSAGASREPARLPFLDLHKDREAILAATEKLLAIEQEDQEKLKKLAREVKDFRDTTLWELVLKIMEADNSKHRMILKFVRDHARHPD